MRRRSAAPAPRAHVAFGEHVERRARNSLSNTAGCARSGHAAESLASDSVIFDRFRYSKRSLSAGCAKNFPRRWKGHRTLVSFVEHASCKHFSTARGCCARARRAGEKPGIIWFCVQLKKIRTPLSQRARQYVAIRRPVSKHARDRSGSSSRTRSVKQSRCFFRCAGVIGM